MTHEHSVVESELRRWGFWLGIQYAADGYSPMSTLVQLLSGRGSEVGHRILCVDPPARSRFWEINRNVLQLNRELYEVLVARYALTCDYETGEPFSAHRLSVALGIPLTLYSRRLHDAKRAYHSVVFPNPFVRSEFAA